MRFRNLILSTLFIFSEAYGQTFTVVLDAGHDSLSVGVQNEHRKEKDLTLSVVRLLEKQFKTRSDFRTLLTRAGDYPLSFDERRRIANTNAPGIFLSFHFSNTVSIDPPDINIFVLNSVQPLNPGRFVRLEQAHLPTASTGIAFVNILQNELKTQGKAASIQTSNYLAASLAGITLPSILIELDSISSPTINQWEDETTLQEFGNTLLHAIDRLREEGKNSSP